MIMSLSYSDSDRDRTMESKKRPSPYNAKLLVAPDGKVDKVLADPIIQSCKLALQSRDLFTIALSGGSLPSLLQTLPQSFHNAGVDPQWKKWHVLLADERCVVSTDDYSNLGSIQSNFTNHVSIPKHQVYGIDETLLSKTSETVASAYEEQVVKPLIEKCDGMLDCVVLGFGPDGHTCSLFPDHPLLNEHTRLVAPIDDSPKPPPSRITLTFPVLNKLSRQVIFCGAGSSKRPILKDVFGYSREALGDPIRHIIDGARALNVEMIDPPPYPCGMVRPEQQGRDSLVWVVDRDAFPTS